MRKIVARVAGGAAITIALGLAACSITDLPMRGEIEALGYKWTEVSRVEATTPVVGDQFGRSVAMYGDWAAIGDNADNSYAGAVYLYSKAGGTWQQVQKLTGSSSNDYFGTAVAIHGGYLLIGAPGAATNSGRAYIYRFDGSSWGTSAYRTLVGPVDPAGYFGQAVALSDLYAFVASADHSSGQGRAYAYYRNEGTADSWGAPSSYQTLMKASGRTAGDLFGSSIAVDGEYCVVGSPETNVIPVTPGAAHVFQLQGGTWTQVASLTAGDPLAREFGSAVSISGSSLAVGAPAFESSYVFTLSGTVWGSGTRLYEPSGAAGNHFGASVAIYGSNLVVGSPDDSGAGSFAGSVTFFRRDSEGWKRERRSTAASPVAGAQLGSASAMYGSEGLVAALGNTSPDVSGSSNFYERVR